MNRTEIINSLLKQNNGDSYLEIGIDNPFNNFTKIECKNKTGVDPVISGINNIHPITSDEFFNSLSPEVKYDLVFIDGLHLWQQVDKDIHNSLNHLTENGFIVVHDCNPPTEEMQVEHYDGYSAWNGTVWKSIVRLKATRDDLSVCVVDDDWGVGVISKGKQKLLNIIGYDLNNLQYEYLDRNRVEALNLISVNEFKKEYLL